MPLTYIKIVLYRNDVRIVLISTITGGILQILCRRYMKNHPELFEKSVSNRNKKRLTKNKRRLPRLPFPRGGAFMEFRSLIQISGINLNVVVPLVIKFVAKKGFLIGLAGGSGVVGILKIKDARTAISIYLRDAFVQNLPDLDKTKYIMVKGERIYLDQCDPNLEYLFKVLEDSTIPFEEKEKFTRRVILEYLDLRKPAGRVNFIICMVFVLYIFSIQNTASFYILMQNLAKAIRDGKISKGIGRLIIRKLKNKGVTIDPDLMDAVAS